VFVGAAAEHQFARTLEDGGVTVGGTDAQGDECACWVAVASELEVLRGAAVAELVARLEAQEFIDGQIPVSGCICMRKACF
jgi:hypothetical protein